MLDEARERYEKDGEFHAAVNVMRHFARRHGFTPYEMKQVATYAAYLEECERMPTVKELTPDLLEALTERKRR